MVDNILDHDVIIVGGGPGGATAGYLLKKMGFDVIIIEKEIFPRQKLCGGLVSLKTVDLLYQIYGETIPSLRRQGIFNYLCDHHEIYYKFERYITQNLSPIPFFFVERKVYDNFLLNHAKQAGVKVLEGEKISSVDISNCEVVLPNGKTLKSNFIIAADGANSVVRQEFFKKGLLSEKEWKFNMGTGVEAHVDRKLLKKDMFDHPILVLGNVKWGYGWIFPNKDKLVVGLGALNRKNKGKFISVLKDMLKAIKVDPNAIKISGHPVPYGNFVDNPVYDNKVILIGDAGGFVDPMYGEGIYFTQRTGQFAALAIQKYHNKKHMIKPYYMHRLHQEIYPHLKNFMRLRWLCFNFVNVGLKYLPIQFLIRLIEKKFMEIINGVRPFRLWKKELEINEVLLRK